MSGIGSILGDIVGQVEAAGDLDILGALGTAARPQSYVIDASQAAGIAYALWGTREAIQERVNPTNYAVCGATLAEWISAAESDPAAETITLGTYTQPYENIEGWARDKIPFFAQGPVLHWVGYQASGTIRDTAMAICANAAAEWSGDHHEDPIGSDDMQRRNMLCGNPANRFPDTRDVFLSGSSAGGSGGGSGTTPLPFVAGGPWEETAFRGKEFALEPVLKAGFGPAVRPGTGGYIVDHPHRYATIHVIDIDGTVRFSTTDFALQKVSKQVGEKFQSISTWDGPQLVFRCERGSIYQLGFSMLNTKNFDWLRAFQMNWTRHFRGSTLAANQSRLYVLYGATLLGGYPIGMSISESTTAEPLAQLVIQMYITDDVPLPDMTIINATNGEYTWEGDTFTVGDGVSNLAGYVRQASPTIDSTNSTFGADVLPSSGEALA